jgi:hypothetical protein
MSRSAAISSTSSAVMSIPAPLMTFQALLGAQALERSHYREASMALLSVGQSLSPAASHESAHEPAPSHSQTSEAEALPAQPAPTRATRSATKPKRKRKPRRS